jgi:23S rRNA pseudouridine955/2504/2580 synthase
VSAERVAQVTVGEDGAGQRLDNYLLKLAKGVPKSHVYRIVRSGEVRVNKARATVSQRLAAGDVLRVPPLRTAAACATPRATPLADLPPILFEDAHLLVVDKPAGLAAHGGSGIAFGLIERLRAARPQQPFLELAHRLDRETSGVLLLAKTRRALVRLHQQLRQGEVDKRYLTLAVGDWVNDRQHIKAPLTKYVTKTGERRVSVDPEGMPSHTIFSLRERLGAFSLLEAQLKSGRTHQIRVHLAHAGFAIAGDDKYGDFELNRRLAKGEFGAKLGRMFLHAFQASLVHPVSGEKLVLEAPLPADCDELLRALRHD